MLQMLFFYYTKACLSLAVWGMYSGECSFTKHHYTSCLPHQLHMYLESDIAQHVFTVARVLAKKGVT